VTLLPRILPRSFFLRMVARSQREQARPSKSS
jgi:hypothetical protein